MDCGFEMLKIGSPKETLYYLLVLLHKHRKKTINICKRLTKVGYLEGNYICFLSLFTDLLIENYDVTFHRKNQPNKCVI